MCETYIDSIGYVCGECQYEFREYLIAQGIEAKTEGQILRALEKFIETRKGDFSEGPEISVDDFFRQHLDRG